MSKESNGAAARVALVFEVMVLASKA